MCKAPSHFTCAEFNTYLGRLKLLNSTFDSRLIHNRCFVSSAPRPFLLRVFSRAISNVADNGSFSPCLRSYISQLIRVNRKRRLVVQVALSDVLAGKEKIASGGFSCFAVATFGTKHHKHFKHVYLVREKQERHIASDSVILFLPNRAWHLGRKVEL